MTSSDRPGRRLSFTLAALLAILVLAAIGYTVAWFHYAGVIQTRLERTVASLGRQGVTLDCVNVAIDGFPTRFRLHCDHVRYADLKGGASAAATALRATADVYDPFHIKVALKSPSEVAMPDLGRYALDWNMLAGSAALTPKHIRTVAVEGENISASSPTAAPDPQPLFDLANVSARAELKGADLGVTGDFDGLEFGAALPDLAKLPPLSGDGDVTVAGGATLFGQSLDSLRGRSLHIARLSLSPGTDSAVTVSGDASVDADGLVDARLQLELQDPQALAATAADAFPQAAGQINGSLAMLAALGDQPTLPLSIRKGKVSLGLIQIGRIPPLP